MGFSHRRASVLGTLIWLASAASLAAEVSIPPAPKSYFNDHAGLVSTDVARRLEERLQRFDEESSNQVVVAIFPELPSPSLEDFTVRTAQSWRVGRKKLDNGAVLFVFVKDRKMRLEVGYGLEGALPDATAKRIIEDVIAPAFGAGKHAQGIEAGIDAIIAATRGEYRPEERKPGGAVLIVVIAFLALIFGFSALLPRLAPRATYDSVGWRAAAGFPWPGMGPRRRRSGYGFGGFRGGSGGSWGGGGFSGGGGSFGGGGASGSW